MRKKIAILTTCFASVLSFVACTTGGNADTLQPVVDGGHVDNSYKAPTEFTSRNIESFKTTFYLWDTLHEENTGSYSFEISKNENGEYILSEDVHYNVSVTVDADVLEKLQVIIEDNKLNELNGTDKYTSGLPEEYAPFYMSVVYDSGETLYFSTDNDPEAEWAKDIKELFVNEFIAAGHEELRANEEDGAVVSFEMGYIDGDLEYLYATVYTEDDAEDYSVHFMKNVYNRVTKEVVVDEIIEIPENFYEELEEITNNLSLKDNMNGDVCPAGMSKMDKYAYYTMDTDKGLQINAFYEGEESESLCELLKKTAEYIDSFF